MALAANLGKATPEDFARAIMTTDAFHKISHREVSLPGGVVKLVGMAKGAGMICPNMATMLSVVLCDAQVEASVWQKMLRDAVELTFNRVTVDGDTSTNDTLYGLANGASGVSASDEESLKALSAALTSVLGDLAYMLVKDGEGASKVARIHVTGAASDADAERVARTVGHSQLVKTALYGRDANWGRIVAAVGRSGADFNPDDVVVTLCGVELFRKGQPTDLDFDALLEEPLKQRDLPIDIVLGSGSGSYTLLASDLGHEYVRADALSDDVKPFWGGKIFFREVFPPKKSRQSGAPPFPKIFVAIRSLLTIFFGTDCLWNKTRFKMEMDKRGNRRNTPFHGKASFSSRRPSSSKAFVSGHRIGFDREPEPIGCLAQSPARQKRCGREIPVCAPHENPPSAFPERARRHEGHEAPPPQGERPYFSKECHA